MRLKIILFILFAAFLSAPTARAVEFDTSTGEEDIVLMSTDGEVNMGDSLAKTVEEQFKVVKDDVIQKKANDIGQRLAAVCDRRDIIYHFKVIDVKDNAKEADKPIINAFSLPGGYVYVFKDLYDAVKNEDELAGVIGHEMAHIVARHSAKRLQAALGANLLAILGSQAQTNPQNFGKALYAINTLMSAYGREDEIFADKAAVKYTRKAGFNPEGVVTFLQKLLEIQKKEPLRPYISERTHPYLSIRISKARQEVYGKMDFNDYINIPSETRR